MTTNDGTTPFVPGVRRVDNTAKRVREYIEKRAQESASTQTIMRREIEHHSGVFETAEGGADSARRGVVGKEIQYISRRAKREAVYAVDGMLRMTDRMTPDEFQRLGGRGKPRQGIYLLNPVFAKSGWQDYREAAESAPKAALRADVAADDVDINELF